MAWAQARLDSLVTLLGVEVKAALRPALEQLVKCQRLPEERCLGLERLEGCTVLYDRDKSQT